MGRRDDATDLSGSAKYSYVMHQKWGESGPRSETTAQKLKKRRLLESLASELLALTFDYTYEGN